jgi:hypothetical protein
MKTNIVVTEENTEAGAVVWFELSGPVDHDRLCEAWEKEGLDPNLLPSLPSPEVALARAVREHSGRRLLARRVEAGHWALVSETTTEDKKLHHEVVTVARLGKDVLVVEPEHPGIRSSFAGNLEVLDSNDISNWLIQLARAAKAVSLRPMGGIYFLPKLVLEQFRRYARALESVSGHHVHRIPAMRTDEAVAAVLSAITAEAESEAEAFEKELSDNTLGARGFDNRATSAQAMKEKLASYEELLGVSLPALSDKLERLRGSLAAAALMKAAAKEAA